MSIGSVGQAAADGNIAASQQRADLETASGQYHHRVSQGTAEASAVAAAKSAQDAAAAQGVTVTLSSAAQAVNAVAGQSLSQSGAAFNPGPLAAPYSVGAQKGDLGEAAAEYRNLSNSGNLEAGVATAVQTARADVSGKLSLVG